MIVIGFGALGALLGFMRAKKHGGSGLDRAWMAGVFALIGMIAGLFVTIGLERSL